MKDILDGKYVGELSPQEVISQFSYRIQIHESYVGLVIDDPDKWIAFGSYEWHMWAINGYSEAIRHLEAYIKGSCPEPPQSSECVFSQTMASAANSIYSLLGKKTRFNAMVGRL